MPDKKIYIGLGLIITLSLVLRLMGLFCSLPSKSGRLSTFHFDEYLTFDSIGKMNPSRLDFYPHTNITSWGTFQLYMQAGILKAMQVVGLLKVGNKEWFRKNLHMADRMYISGRIAVMFFSCLSLILLFILSRRFLTGWFTLVPPLFMSVAYSDVFMSSLVKPDVIMVFWGLCCFYWALKLFDEGLSPRNVAMTALFNGLSFSTKYTGLLFGFFFALFMVVELYRNKTWLKCAAFSALYLAVSFLVFVTVNPYFILKNSEVMAEMIGISAKASLLGPGGMTAGYLEFFTQNLPFALGWPFLIFSLAAIGYALANRRREIVLSALFSLFYFIRFGYPHDQLFTYTLLTVPFLCMTSGWLIMNIFGRNFLYKLLPAAVFLYSFSYSFYQKSRWNDSNTLMTASSWIEGNLDKKSIICLSRVEVWTPPALRRYDTTWTLKTFCEPYETFEKGFEGLAAGLKDCDYVLVSEMEKQRIAIRPELRGLEEGLSSGFTPVKEFTREDNPFFITNKKSRQALLASFMNPEITVYRRKQQH